MEQKKKKGTTMANSLVLVNLPAKWRICESVGKLSPYRTQSFFHLFTLYIGIVYQYSDIYHRELSPSSILMNPLGEHQSVKLYLNIN